MQFTGFVLIALFSIQSAFAASSSEEFDFLTIHSGSDLQYAGIIAEGSKLYFGSGSSSNSLRGNITDCGFLQFQDGSYAHEEANGFLTKGSRHEATPGFRISDGYMEFQNGFLYGIKDNNQYRVSAKATSNDSLGAYIRALSVKGNGNSTVPIYIPDYTPNATGPSC